MDHDTEAGAQTFGDLVRDYVRHPDDERLHALREAVTRSSSFDPDLELHSAMAPLLRRGDHAAVVTGIIEQMPGAALNPSAHRLLSFALAALGERAASEREARMSRLSVSSVLATGDGSHERPWSVLRVADEYDILRARKVRVGSQSTRREEGRVLDRHESPDGQVTWFVLDPAGVR